MSKSVLLFTPTYYPMFAGIKHRVFRWLRVIFCSMIRDIILLDYEDVRKKTRDTNLTVALIGNPHNPIGKLYTMEEMTKLADILIENNVKIICDDIHCDLVVDGTKKYVPLSSIDKYKERYYYECSI